MSPADRPAPDLSPAALPTSTWSALDAVLRAWREGSVPKTVTAAAIPLGGGPARKQQVVQTLRTLGLIDQRRTATVTLRGLLRRGEGLVDLLRARWPNVVDLLERAAPPSEVAAAFAAVPATSDSTSRRFRTFVLAACEREGIDVAAYRRLGSTAAPTAPRRRRYAGRPGAPVDGPLVAAEQLRREVTAYENALDAALGAAEVDRAAALSAQLANLREELRRS